MPRGYTPVVTKRHGGVLLHNPSVHALVCTVACAMKLTRRGLSRGRGAGPIHYRASRGAERLTLRTADNKPG